MLPARPFRAEGATGSCPPLITYSYCTPQFRQSGDSPAYPHTVPPDASILGDHRKVPSHPTRAQASLSFFRWAGTRPARHVGRGYVEYVPRHAEGRGRGRRAVQAGCRCVHSALVPPDFRLPAAFFSASKWSRGARRSATWCARSRRRPATLLAALSSTPGAGARGIHRECSDP